MTTSSPSLDPAQLRPDQWWNKLAIHKVPATYIVVTSFISYIILALSVLQGLPPWLSFGMALMPWGAIIFLELEWTYQHYHWFAIFTLMAVVQTIHYSEHCIEIVQYHIFHVPLAHAIAIFSALNIELVHFSGDTFLTIGTLALITKFPRNPWLWVAVPFQILHQAEHTFLTYNYLFNGAPAGGPGLLAKGGAIAGGLPLVRPDLHWIYNTLFTIPFVLALIYQLKHTYDEALHEAFPNVPEKELVEATRHLETFHYSASETVLAPGDDAERLYVITDGEAAVYQPEVDGREVEIGRLHKGEYFGEVALTPGAEHTKIVRAVTALDVLAMDKPTFEHLMTATKATADHMDQVAAESASGVPGIATT